MRMCKCHLSKWLWVHLWNAKGYFSPLDFKSIFVSTVSGRAFGT